MTGEPYDYAVPTEQWHQIMNEHKHHEPKGGAA